MVTYVSASIDPTTHRLTVRAEIDNTDGALRPEMLARFRIATGPAQDGPAIPIGALVYEGADVHVWAADTVKKTVSMRQIEIAAVTELLTILRKQYALGQVSMADVAAQEAALAQARQALPPLRKQLAQQRDALTALVGRFSDRELAEKFDLASLTLPTDLPLSLPSNLVQQRPDIKAAEATMHAASAQIGQAVAARLPQISITGSVGSSANRIADLFSPGTAFWSIAGGLTAPLFDAGILLHKQRAAEAGFDQAAAQYKATVLAAFQNVADTLQALQADADALKAATESEQAAARSLGIVRRQLAAGQVAYPVLLNAQQTYQTSRIALVQAQASRFADTVALFQALGGGWWNRDANTLQ